MNRLADDPKPGSSSLPTSVSSRRSAICELLRHFYES